MHFFYYWQTGGSTVRRCGVSREGEDPNTKTVLWSRSQGPVSTVSKRSKSFRSVAVLFRTSSHQKRSTPLCPLFFLSSLWPASVYLSLTSDRNSSRKLRQPLSGVLAASSSSASQREHKEPTQTRKEAQGSARQSFLRKNTNNSREIMKMISFAASILLVIAFLLSASEAGPLAGIAAYGVCQTG